MSTGPSFFQTPMGRAFFERDVPALVKNLGRIADALEQLVARLPPPSPAPAPEEKKSEQR